MLVLVAGMIPVPGEPPARWWDNTGSSQAVHQQARRDGGLTGSGDPFVAFYHDVPRTLAEEAMRRERDESDAAYQQPWPLTAWPAVTTRFVLCTEDRFFPSDFLRRVVVDNRPRRDHRWTLRRPEPPRRTHRFADRLRRNHEVLCPTERRPSDRLAHTHPTTPSNHRP
jgi:hypothetical protein